MLEVTERGQAGTEVIEGGADAEGALDALGVPHSANINYWLKSTTPADYLLRHDPRITPDDCDVVVVVSVVGIMGFGKITPTGFLPEEDQGAVGSESPARKRPPKKPGK